MPRHPIYLLPCLNSQGSLLLTPCPGTKNTTLDESLKQLKAAGARTILTLMPSSEMQLNAVANLQSLCKGLGVDWFQLCIEDEGAPEQPFIATWDQCRTEIHKRLDNNEAIAIHCKGGSGRTGLVAAQILIERGEPVTEAMRRVKDIRPNAFVHQVQIDYITELND